MWQAISRLLSEQLGEGEIELRNELPGGEVHAAWHLRYAGHDFFVKCDERELLPGFTAEADQLELLSRSKTVTVPKVWAVGADRDYSFLVMDYLPPRPLDAHSAFILGQQIARLHQWSDQPQFGLDFDNSLSTTPQPNTWQRRWSTFFAEQRIGWQLELAAEKGIAFGNIDAIVEHDFRRRGLDVGPDEVFVSDGAKSDTGNFGELLSADCRIAVADPVYPVYVDSNVMAGRADTLGPDGRWSRIVYLPCTAEGGFKPDLPDERVDVVYLCSPNNPTGVALTRDELKRWVDYALANEVLLLFDAAYEAFVRHDDVPHSVYEIDGARDCAVEFRSFSKTAGFTGVRCGYTVVPRCLKVRGADGRHVALTPLWNRRQCTKFNGASYITQRGAEAIYTPEGQRQVREHIDYYLANARLLREGAARAGLEAYGGEDSPYVWLRTPEGCGSWAFFDRLLADAGLVTTPGVGFGPCGEGYVRLTAFNTHEATAEAVERLATL